MKVYTVSAIRNEDVVNAFFDAVKSMRKDIPYTPQDKIIEHALKGGAPRFYTTFENARRFVSLLERGKDLPLTNPNKIAMYRELHRRYREIRERQTCCNGYSVLENIIEQPAPSFYIDIDTFRGILYKSYKRR